MDSHVAAGDQTVPAACGTTAALLAFGKMLRLFCINCIASAAVGSTACGFCGCAAAALSCTRPFVPAPITFWRNRRAQRTTAAATVISNSVLYTTISAWVSSANPHVRVVDDIGELVAQRRQFDADASQQLETPSFDVGKAVMQFYNLSKW